MKQKHSSRGNVLITGASSGIGKACAIRLGRLGFQVFAGVRKEQDGEALKKETSGRIVPVLLDVTDAASIASAAKFIESAAGEAGLAGLVNNAGIVVAGPLEFISIDDIRKQFEVNLFGQIAVTRAFLPLLRKAKGRIVNMSSNSGIFASPFLGPYAASKFAFEAVSDSLRLELHSSGVGVSIIEPGDIATPIWGKSIAAAERRLENFPPEAHSYYGADFDAVRKAAEKSRNKAIPPEEAAKAVARALTSRRPKTRYRVGLGVMIEVMLKRILPDRWLDRLILRYAGMSGCGPA